VALTCGVAMVLLQSAIGVSNDILDRAHDQAVKPWKPIPRGLVTLRTARVAATGGAAAGLALAFLVAPIVGVVAAAGLATGLAYDFWLKRTPFSWLPYAIGLPLVPAYAWLAARGTLPDQFAALVVLGVIAGVSVALANGLVDLDADAASSRGGLALRVGRRASLAALAAADFALLALVAGYVAVGVANGGLKGTPGAAVHGGSSASAEPAHAWPARAAGVLFVAGCAAMLVGLALSSSARESRRERGWELQASAIALVAAAWLAITNG
jgi:4-hydroxybenzoate polyprenyltransferase